MIRNWACFAVLAVLTSPRYCTVHLLYLGIYLLIFHRQLTLDISLHINLQIARGIFFSFDTFEWLSSCQ